MNDIEFRQQAGMEVERKMLEFLMQWSPADEMKIVDVKQIAFFARRIAFEAFSPVKTCD